MTDAEVLLSLVEAGVNRGQRTVLDGFELQLCSGEILGLVGKNGCGKSTVIETAAGLLPLRRGRVEHRDSEDLVSIADSEGRRRRARPFGLCLQGDSTTGEEKVIEHLLTSSRLAGQLPELDSLEEICKKWGLGHRIHDRVGTLSEGLSRRISVLAAMVPAWYASEPTLILLDEPSEGLDESCVDLLIEEMEALATAGHGILLASHDQRLFGSMTRRILWKEGDIEVEPTTVEPVDLDLPILESDGCDSRRVYSAWVNIQEARTRHTMLNAGIAAAMTLLLLSITMPDAGNDEAGWRMWCTFVLLPSLVISLIPGAERLLERNSSGSWWAAQTGGDAPNAVASQIPLMGVMVTIIATLSIPRGELPDPALNQTLQVILIGSICCWMVARINLMLWIIHRWLPRPRQASQLLMVFIILPWIILVDGTGQLMVDGWSTDAATSLGGGFGILIMMEAALRLLRR